jgi:hypothetical protein
MTTTRHKGRSGISLAATRIRRCRNRPLPSQPFGRSLLRADYVAEDELRQPASRLACPFRARSQAFASAVNLKFLSFRRAFSQEFQIQKPH